MRKQNFAVEMEDRRLDREAEEERLAVEGKLLAAEAEETPLAREAEEERSAVEEKRVTVEAEEKRLAREAEKKTVHKGGLESKIRSGG